MEFEEEFDDAYDIVTLTTDEGDSEDFYIIDAAKFEGFTYVLTVPVEGQDDEVLDAVILREIASESDDETISYDIVLDEEEFEKVASFFSESGDFDITVD